jgi:glycosyltransferase involved in cell wall biosynthesis
VYVTARGHPEPEGRTSVSLSFGILSTYPPTQCGLATFSAALAAELTSAGDSAGVVRVVDFPDPFPAAAVVHQLGRDSRDGPAAAAAVLDTFDVVVVQHEFGVYGGLDGERLLDVLDVLSPPVIVVAHTVLVSPTPHQRGVLERVVQRADAVVTMSVTARDRLLAGYRVDPAKVVIIPHGAATSAAARPTRPAGPPTILTWGLLGPGKGIESVIDAMADLRSMNPPPRYRIVGRTHPRVIDREGETYRRALINRAAHRGVDDLVSFHPAYLDTAALNQVVAGADVVVLPYESREQVTSGVLIEALAAGKPVVATAFPHAVELLADGAGLVVPHDDPAALAHALRRVLTEPGLAASMANRAAPIAPHLRWSSVADRYRGLAADLVDASVSVAGR